MSLKRFVNSHDMYPDFTNFLLGKMESLHKSLEQAKELHEIYRLQGQILGLRKLLNLREEINYKDSVG